MPAKDTLTQPLRDDAPHTMVRLRNWLAVSNAEKGLWMNAPVSQTIWIELKNGND
ncbi:unnamed protein product, partial [marine sediment metagenome]